MSGGNSHLSSNAHILDFDSVKENAFSKSTRCKKLSGEKREPPKLFRSALRPSSRQAQNGNDPTNDQTRRLPENDKAITENQGGEADFDFFRPTAVVDRILRSDSLRASKIAHEQLARRKYEGKKVAERQVVVPKWREILDELKRHTPDGADFGHDHVFKIKLPFSALTRFLFDEEDNLWTIKWRYGCQIELTDAGKTNQGRRFVLLSGPLRNIQQAAMEILQVIPGAIADEEVRVSFEKLGKQRPALSVDGPSTSKVRFITSVARLEMTRPISADKVTRPPIWTPESFGSYIEELTSIKMPTHMHKILYNPGENHIDAVVDILKTVFLKPECRTAISVEAFNDALAYLIKHNAIHVVRDLFVHMDLQNLTMNTNTFNIMLRGAAKSRSIGNFSYILRLMLRRGFTPDGDTWLAFMRVVEDPRIKLHILKVMKSKELLLGPQIRKRVCNDLVEVDINTSLDNLMPLDHFLSQMADYYGKDWLTADSANKILDVLGSRGLISYCWEFIEFMHTKNVNPKNINIGTVLHHCKKQDNPQAAVEIIRRASSLIFFNPDQQIYRALFDIAWVARLQCVARVVWHYACLNAATTYLMRKRISEGAQRAISSSSHSSTLESGSHKEWGALASRFILGLPIPPHDQEGSPIPDDSSHIISPTLHHNTAQAPTNPSEENFHWASQEISLAEEGIDQGKENFNPAKQNETLDREHSSKKENSSIEEDPSPSNTDSNRALVKAAFKEQLHIHRMWEARRPFADVLVEAFQTDKEWTLSGASCKDERLEWLSWKMPKIPLRKKPPPLVEV